MSYLKYKSQTISQFHYILTIILIKMKSKNSTQHNYITYGISPSLS